MTTWGRFMPKLGLGRWRAVDINVHLESGFSFLELLWGTDIFINGVPVIKTIILANIIVWILLFYSIWG